MDILRGYAETGNRELYWNYLARHEGSDGYGLLALGVVRNDNMPGAVANAYAQNFARSENGRNLSEREWETFGENLVSRDFERRQLRMAEGRPDLALNLPVSDVQLAHDQTFRRHGIDPNAWTPRRLLEAAHRQGGDEAAQQVWGNMLNNAALGIGRAGITSWDVMYTYNDEQMPATRYMLDLAGASAMAANARSNVDPDVIGASNFYYMYDRNAREWSSVSSGGMAGPMIRRVTDAGTIAELDDARRVRLERQEQAREFHPDDPNRERGIARSPFTLADAGPDAAPGTQTATGDRVRLASISPTRSDGMDTSHPDYPLYSQIRSGVQRLDAAHGRPFDDTSERISASLLPLAKENGITRVDEVMLSNGRNPNVAPGQNIFLVQGSPDDPAMQRAHMPTQLAAQASVAESMERLATINQTLEQQTRQASLEAPRQQQAPHQLG
ncbi:XVIPCD domain-containing protein [Luteimonas aquatica]|uniref:XVIPCD domain-containing protein n=1 Tax=Luteimonas aquatica TaxID=450364 RepID=UPI001F5A0CA2|nr:XVIPCD domain-containing protein [Luteimonas aquatica]